MKRCEDIQFDGSRQCKMLQISTCPPQGLQKAAPVLTEGGCGGTYFLKSQKHPGQVLAVSLGKLHRSLLSLLLYEMLDSVVLVWFELAAAISPTQLLSRF